MVVRWGDVAVALVTFLMLVVLPLGAIRLLPIATLTQIEASSLNVQFLALQTAVLGLVVVALTLIKALVMKTSIVYLVVEISSNIASLVFALLVVGIGNIGNLGYSSLRLTQAKLTTEIILDLRIFIWLTIAIVTLSIFQSVAKYREAKNEEVLKKVRTSEAALV